MVVLTWLFLQVQSNGERTSTAPARAALPSEVVEAASAGGHAADAPGLLGKPAEVPAVRSASTDDRQEKVGGQPPVRRPPIRAGTPRQIGADTQRQRLLRQWEHAEAARLQFRQLFAQGQVSWDDWRARENEALRLRLKLRALGWPNEPG